MPAGLAEPAPAFGHRLGENQAGPEPPAWMAAHQDGFQQQQQGSGTVWGSAILPFAWRQRFQPNSSLVPPCLAQELLRAQPTAPGDPVPQGYAGIPPLPPPGSGSGAGKLQAHPKIAFPAPKALPSLSAQGQGHSGCCIPNRRPHLHPGAVSGWDFAVSQEFLQLSGSFGDILPAHTPRIECP